MLTANGKPNSARVTFQPHVYISIESLLSYFSFYTQLDTFMQKIVEKIYNL